jgi:hypothetical protein
MKKMLLAAAAGMALVSGGVEAREFADIYTQCGLGAMIAPNNDAVAVITNVTWDLGTTAISSNASSADTCKGGQKKVASLLLQSLPQVEKDLAMGSGQYADALVASAGCSASSREQVIAAVREDLVGLAAQPSYAGMSRVEKSAALYDAVQKRVDTDFVASCTMN